MPVLAKPVADEPPVGLELRFAGAARADAAGLPFEVLPHAGQARQRVLELRQLDLQPRFPRAGAAREDVEDQLGAVDHLALGRLLQVAHLCRREVVVEDDHLRLALLDEQHQFFELALADERCRVDGPAALHQRAGDDRARRVGEQRQLLHRALQVPAVAGGMADEHDVLAARRAGDLVRGSLHEVTPTSRS